MNLFYFIFACAVLGKTRAIIDPNITLINALGYFPQMQSMPCEEWTVDLVDTCDEISFVKRAGNPIVIPELFETFPTAWYYPTATIGVKGKYGLNPVILSYEKLYEIAQNFNIGDGDISEMLGMINCSFWSSMLNCINGISNNNISPLGTNESIQCNETTKEIIKTMFMDFSVGSIFPTLIQLPEKKQCIELFNSFNNSDILLDDLLVSSNTSFSATIHPKSDGVSVGVIVGIVVGSVVVLLGIGIGIWYFNPIASSDDTELFLKQ